MNTQTIALSVVIPTYQRRASVARLLNSLNNQTLAADRYEVIVVIDGSTDGTSELVAQLVTPYRLQAIAQPNQGRATACNTGIAAAHGEVIMLLDDDMEATPALLAAHLRAHADHAARAVVGAAPIPLQPSAPPLVQFMSAGFAHRLARFAQPGYQLRFKEAYSGNFSIRRATLLQVGGFDQAFTVYGYEDYELALRLAQAGVRLCYSAEALAYQHYTKTFAGVARDSMARGRSALVFAQKHPAIVPELKLNQYAAGSRKWRLLRGALLWLSRWLKVTPAFLIWLVQRLEQWRPKQMALVYSLTLDYCYWLGVQTGLQAQPQRAQAPDPFPALAGKAHQ